MIYRHIADLKVKENLLFMGFKTGDTQIFTWDEDQKDLFKITCDKQDEHEDELMSIDMLQSRGLFVTGGKDGIIKVWNMRKELVREIKFPEPITAVCFFNQQGDILVGHVGKVSSVMAIDYKPFENQELTAFSQELLSNFLTSHSRGGSSPATDHTFQKLKKQDDDIRRQIQELMKKKELD
jgi:WD40 repeat protein